MLNSKDNIKLFFVGDFCCRPSLDKVSISPELQKLINTCELKICNFEVPLKPNGSEILKGKFHQNDGAPDFLESIGFNLFSFANNHVFDYGVEGFKKTINSFKNSSVFGSGKFEEAYKVHVSEINGYKIGFLAVTYASKDGVFEDSLSEEGYGCAYINHLKVNHLIIEAKRSVDYLIILPHDGIEYIDIPTPNIIARYRDFIEYGADAVIGTHPHCPQGWEIYKEKPIFYSLGNFFFNSKDTYDFFATKPNWYNGLAVLLSICPNTGKVSFKVYNTYNHNNRRIDLDNSKSTKVHNEKICNYLINKEEYLNVLRAETEKLFKHEHANIIDSTIRTSTIPLVFKNLIKKCIQYFTSGQITNNDMTFSELIKNQTRRDILLKALKHNK